MQFYYSPVDLTGNWWESRLRLKKGKSKGQVFDSPQAVNSFKVESGADLLPS